MLLKRRIITFLSVIFILSAGTSYRMIPNSDTKKIAPITYNGIVDSDLMYCEFYLEYPAICIMTA